MNDCPTILIAEDDPHLLELLVARCHCLGLRTITAATALDALTKASLARPDLVCTDFQLPAGSGLGICEMMAADDELRHTPVIVMTGSPDVAVQQRCHELAVYYIPKCVDTWNRLEPLICDLLDLAPQSPDRAVHARLDVATPPLSRVPSCSPVADETADLGASETDLIDVVFSALGWDDTLLAASHDDGDALSAEAANAETRPWVLSIDDDADLTLGLKLRFADQGVELMRSFDGVEGFRRAFATAPRVILLDFEMPEANGDHVLRKLKDNPVTRPIPVVVLTGRRDNALKRRLLNMGAAGFLNKPVRWETLWEVVSSMFDAPVATPPTRTGAALGLDVDAVVEI